MPSENIRTPLGDRVSPSLRNWLARFALRRSLPRSEALNQLLSASSDLDSAGADPLQVLELCLRLRCGGHDPVGLLSRRLS